ncbi:MAG: hypothetical protein V1735_03110 [Nanoarchaeota archaeon]
MGIIPTAGDIASSAVYMEARMLENELGLALKGRADPGVTGLNLTHALPGIDAEGGLMRLLEEGRISLPLCHELLLERRAFLARVCQDEGINEFQDPYDRHASRVMQILDEGITGWLAKLSFYSAVSPQH